MGETLEMKRLAAQLGFDQGGHLAHVGTSGHLRLDDRHHLAHVLHASRAGGTQSPRPPAPRLRHPSGAAAYSPAAPTTSNFSMSARSCRPAASNWEMESRRCLSIFSIDRDHLIIGELDTLIHFALLDRGQSSRIAERRGASLARIADFMSSVTGSQRMDLESKREELIAESDRRG